MRKGAFGRGRVRSTIIGGECHLIELTIFIFGNFSIYNKYILYYTLILLYIGKKKLSNFSPTDNREIFYAIFIDFLALRNIKQKNQKDMTIQKNIK